MNVWRFIRRFFVRMVIGSVLVAVISVAVFVYSAYQQEQRIAAKIKALDGRAYRDCFGPNWIPESIQLRLPIVFCRISYVFFVNSPVPSDALRELKSFKRIQSLAFPGTDITDADLEHLKQLKSLELLRLDRTHVTDSGLERLTELTNLRDLSLHFTPTTVDGRAMLRKALPDCKIEPDP